MTSFKWNVHNHGRTMNLKWLAEIVHANPAWLNPKTVESLGLADGDWIELTSYHSAELQSRSPHLKRDDLPEADGRKVAATTRVPIVTIPSFASANWDDAMTLRHPTANEEEIATSGQVYSLLAR